MTDNSEAAPSVATKAEEESTNPQEPSTVPPILRAYSNKLTPPAEASFWRHQTISLLQDYKLEYLPDEPGINVFETLTWRIDAHLQVRLPPRNTLKV
ncbi:hypothetical protein ONZ45_g9870 [Pleurotus djamor]|nr:hypothetical protein ONZ45_g9870 [Pleurotus djamor]